MELFMIVRPYCVADRVQGGLHMASMFMKMLGYVHSIINWCIVEKIEAGGIEIICPGFCSYLRSPEKRGHSDKSRKTFISIHTLWRKWINYEILSFKNLQ